MSCDLFSTQEIELVHRFILPVVEKLSMPVANVADYELCWDDSLTGGKLASYSVLCPLLIAVTAHGRDCPTHMYTISAIIHELRHAWQLQHYGFLPYCLIGSRLWAHWTTEPSAYQAQAEAEKILQ